MAETQTSVKDVIPDLGGSFHLDHNVTKALPEGSQVLEATSYGTAPWTRAARVSVQVPNEPPRLYFLKCATEEQGKLMIEGEYNSMKAIESYLPNFVPRPCAWGQFGTSPTTYFFLMEFLDLSADMTDPVALCTQLAELHRRSISPTGKFGFHITTCHGSNSQCTEWHENWSFYFTRLLEQFFYRELAANGPWTEYEEAFDVLRKETIPPLLEPLQTEGRTLKPSLIHGDLWEENTGTDLVSGRPIVFDAAAHYAHNEFELGMWRREIVRFGKPYIRQYLRHIPPSAPREQWDDRNRLYSIKYDLAHSIALPDTAQSQRDLIMANMQFLTEKYSIKKHV